MIKRVKAVCEICDSKNVTSVKEIFDVWDEYLQKWYASDTKFYEFCHDCNRKREIIMVEIPKKDKNHEK